MLDVPPPAAWKGGAFMAMDHDVRTGRPRFSCFKREDGKCFSLNCSITLAEFREIFRPCENYYVE